MQVEQTVKAQVSILRLFRRVWGPWNVRSGFVLLV